MFNDAAAASPYPLLTHVVGKGRQRVRVKMTKIT
jgi:hypothetical protein